MGSHLAHLSPLGSNSGGSPYILNGDLSCAITNEEKVVLVEDEKSVLNGTKLFTENNNKFWTDPGILLYDSISLP